jgi:hypothetical protein
VSGYEPVTNHSRQDLQPTRPYARSARRSLPVLVLLLLYAATSLSWLIVTPPFDAPDEIAHYDYARYIAATGHLPDHVPTALREGDWYLTHWPQPPLYYVLVSQAVRAVHAEAVSPLTFFEYDLAEQHGPSARRVIIRETGDRVATRAMFLGRLVSWTFGAGLLVALFAALGAAGASDRTRVMLIASLVLVPAFTANLVAVNNDSMAACVAASTVAVMFGIVARSETRGRGLPAWIGLGVLLGLALSSKSTTTFLVPMAVVSCVMGTGRPTRVAAARAAAVRLGAIALGAMPCLGITAARNWTTFGDPFAASLTAGLARFHPPPRSWTLAGPELYSEVSHSLFTGFTAQFGWAGAMPRSAAIWGLYVALLIVVIALSAIAAIALGVLGRGTPAAVRLTRLAVMGVVVHVASLFVINSVMFAASGRHLLPVVAPAIVLVYCGAAIVARAFRSQGPGAQPGLSLVTRVIPAALLTILAAAWIAVFVELTVRFRYGG